MALDTSAKRASAIGLALFFLRPGVVPDGGNLGAPQRLHAQGLYSGIAAADPVPPVEASPIVIEIAARDAVVQVPAGDRIIQIPERL